MRLLPTVLLAFIFSRNSIAAQTWPSPILDEMEDLMFLLTGYKSRGFAGGVTPCSKSPPGGTDRTASAEWIRTAFHDVAPGSVFTGMGGMDGSIMFELTYPENVGSAFTSTVQAMSPFYNSRASIADLLSLALSTATRSCGGPVVPLRVGRIDATVASNSGQTPLPQNAASIFVNQFARIGFSAAEMIAVVACGHTVGGVHSSNFPRIVAPAADGSEVYSFTDSTGANFDNKIVTEYLGNTTTDPMQRGLCTTNKLCADTTVFGQDKNLTMKKLADQNTFASTCATVFQKLVEVVPKTTTLSQTIIIPYEVKPSFQLTLLDGGSQMTFAGEVRVRTTVRSQSQISSVQINYSDRNGGSSCGSCVIMTSMIGTANGFDDSFAFYSFSTTIDATNSISAFTVKVNLLSGSSQTFDNNGGGFPVQDSIMLQTPQSCLAGNNLNVVAAVRNTLSAASLAVTLQQARDGVLIPALVTQSQPMTQGASYGPYNLYSASYSLPANQSSTTRFDVIGGSNTASDSFKLSGNLGNNCAVLGGAAISNSTSSSSSMFMGTTSLTTMQTVIVSSSSMVSTTSNTSGLPTSSTTSFASTTSSTTSLITTSSTSSSASTVASSSTSSQSPTFTGWTRLGCYTDNTGTRTLSNLLAVPGGDSNTTIENCQSTALKAGYKYAGMEYSRECWASNAIFNGGSLASDGEAQCNMACNGNNAENCGGPDRLNMFTYISGTASSTTSSATASTPTVATATGWIAQGCYVDNTGARTLSNLVSVAGGASNMTNYNCQLAAKAAGYTYAGTEYSQECWAANTISNGGSLASDANTCSMTCNGNSGEICGGPNRLTLFMLQSPSGGSSAATTTSSAVSAQSTTKAAAGWTYLGCYTDPVNPRALPNGLGVMGGSANMTNYNCQIAAKAAGYAYAGTEYSQECWAGNVMSNGAGLASDGEKMCDMACNGGSGGEICGGPGRLSLWGFAKNATM